MIAMFSFSLYVGNKTEYLFFLTAVMMFFAFTLPPASENQDFSSKKILLSPLESKGANLGFCEFTRLVGSRVYDPNAKP